jgi:hypothetical protein
LYFYFIKQAEEKKKEMKTNYTKSKLLIRIYTLLFLGVTEMHLTKGLFKITRKRWAACKRGRAMTEACKSGSVVREACSGRAMREVCSGRAMREACSGRTMREGTTVMIMAVRAVMMMVSSSLHSGFPKLVLLTIVVITVAAARVTGGSICFLTMMVFLPSLFPVFLRLVSTQAKPRRGAMVMMMMLMKMLVLAATKERARTIMSRMLIHPRGSAKRVDAMMVVSMTTIAKEELGEIIGKRVDKVTAAVTTTMLVFTTDFFTSVAIGVQELIQASDHVYLRCRSKRGREAPNEDTKRMIGVNKSTVFANHLTQLFKASRVEFRKGRAIQRY